MGRLGGINLADKVLIFKDSNGKEFAVNAKKKDFKTGSTGYYISGKIEMNGKRYQVSGNVVLIGSKKKVQ